jgi:hypothetical protein
MKLELYMVKLSVMANSELYFTTTRNDKSERLVAQVQEVNFISSEKDLSEKKKTRPSRIGL